jgi:prepilin-type N-terminal cleavage/methylation domain-containing protein
MTRSNAPSSPVIGCLPGRRGGRAPGFTLIELIVCLGVVAVLCGILLPSLRHTRSAAQKVGCSANMREMGVGLSAYSDSNNGRLPPSSVVDPRHFASPNGYRPGDLMASRLRTPPDEVPPGYRWQGLGMLSAYLGPACDCMYCPAHHGVHSRERYLQSLADEDNRDTFTNYHYAGHVQHWRTDALRSAPTRLDMGRDLVLVSDGLRTRRDFNHEIGLNRLFADMSVEWYRDSAIAGESIRDMLPEDHGDMYVCIDGAGFGAVWSRVQRTDVEP